MGPMLKKDLLVFWRDRKEILMALLLPIGIIMILSLVLSGMFEESESQVDIDAALIIEDDQEAGVEEFVQQLQASDLSQDERDQLVMQAHQFNPSVMLQEFFKQPELDEWMTIEEMSKEEATDKIEAGELHAAVYLPEGYTESFLSDVLLGESQAVDIQLLADENTNEVTTLEQIVGSFVESLNLQLATQQMDQAETVEPILPEGGYEQVAGEESEPFSLTQYFTLAMSSLFALFLAQTVATKTVTEKREQVFNRILVTNYRPVYFLLGKILSTTIFAWLQIVITITVIQLTFTVFSTTSVEFWIGILCVITAFSIAIGGLSGIFTALTLNMKDPDAINGVSTVVVMSFGLLGGGFLPIMFLPNFLQQIGIWTPNGKLLTSLLEWVQQPVLQDLIVPVLYLVGFFLVSLLIALAMFPRRGQNK